MVGKGSRNEPSKAVHLRLTNSDAETTNVGRNRASEEATKPSLDDKDMKILATRVSNREESLES